MKKNKREIIFSIVIPMYNGEMFIDNAMHSIINKLSIEENIFDLVEIVVINDGSKDNGSYKAKLWAEEWNEIIRKNFIRVIDKENGQYGSVINKALEIINGRYVKVLDVDDIFDTKCFIEIVQIISSLKIEVDVILTDFIFDKVLDNKQIVYKWDKYFEPYKILKAKNIKFPNTIITMHSIIYRTKFLRDMKYKQIEGIYYSDSQYSIIPFVQAKRFYYINIPLYRYYIGRNDQSININTMVKNRLHQRKVFEKILTDLFKTEINSQAQKKYAWKVTKNMFEWQSMIICHDKSIKNRGKKVYEDLQTLMHICKERDMYAYKIIKNGALSKTIRMTRGHGIVKIIKIGQKLYARFKLNIMADWS